MTVAEKPPHQLMKEALDTIVETVVTTAATVEITSARVAHLAEQHDDTAQAIVKETVAALAAKLETLTPTTLPSEDMALLLADCRDTITEGIGALHTQSADVLHALQILHAPPARPQRPRQRLWVAGVAGMVLGGLLMGATWWAWPEGGHRTFAVALDAILVQYHGHLPQQAQDAIAALYRRYQLQPPGSRQKGRS